MSDSESEIVYKNEHRMFLQAMMWKKMDINQQIINLHKECCEINNVPCGDLKTFIDVINTAISPINMKIVKRNDEVTGDACYVLINTIHNNISLLASSYSVTELEFFKKIMASIIDSDDGKVKTSAVLNLVDELKPNMTKKDATQIIIKFSNDNWLMEKNGYIFFSTRALAELGTFFQTHFKDAIDICDLCKNVIFQGASCKECEKKIHWHCEKNYFKTQNQKKCPSCNCDW